MPPTLETSGSSVIVLGSFNPGIVQPAWLLRYGLIAEAEERDAQSAMEVVGGEYGRLKLSWAIVQVFRDRLEVSATEDTPSPGPIRDLASGILELLPHTPVSRVGINHWGHYRMPSEDEWHALGHRLVPEANWVGVLDRPGMLDVQVRGVRTDDRKGTVNVTVQPSVHVRPGVFIAVNDDFILNEDGEDQSGEDGVEVLRAAWDEADRRALEITDHVLAGP